MTDTERKVWIIGICEDDPSDMEEVCQMISREMKEQAVLRRYGTTEELFEDLNTGKRNRLDILYLDILLPGENGLSAAEQIKAVLPGTGIVFISSSRDYAVDAFRVDALDYLVKPVTQSAVRESLERAMRLKREKRKSRLFVQTNHEKVAVYQDQIMYFRSDNQRVKLFFYNGKEMSTYMPLYSLEEELGPEFIKLKRGTVVNMQYVKVMGPSYCIMDDGVELEIGRNHRARVHRDYENYIYREISKRADGQEERQ